MTFKVHNALYKYSLSNIMIILALEKNEVVLFAEKRVQLEIIIVSESNKSQKAKGMFSLNCGTYVL